MPAPRPHRPVRCTRLSEAQDGYPRTMTTVRDRLIREAFTSHTALEISEFVSQAAQERGLADKLEYPWWYGVLPKDQPATPISDRKREALAHARECKAKLRDEVSV